MSSDLKKRLWLGVVVVVAAALAFAGPSIIAGVKDTAMAAGCCGMGSSASSSDASSSGCGMDMGSSSSGCGMMGSKDGMACQGCTMVTGSVTAVDKRDGSITVKIKPAASATAATKTALSQVKVGDSISMGLMLGKPAAAKAGATAQAAKYACPMHPEVTSNKPGTCPKCNMNLEPVSTTQK